MKLSTLGAISRVMTLVSLALQVGLMIWLALMTYREGWRYGVLLILLLVHALLIHIYKRRTDP